MSDVLSKTLSKKGFAKTAAYVDSQKDSDVKFITMRELLRDIINPLVQKAETDVRALRIVAGVLPLLRSNELVPEKSKPANFKIPKPDGNIAKFASVVEELFIDGPFSERLVKIAAYVPEGKGNTGLTVKKADVAKDISLLWVPESWFKDFTGSEFSEAQQRKASIAADAMMKLAQVGGALNRAWDSAKDWGRGSLERMRAPVNLAINNPVADVGFNNLNRAVDLFNPNKRAEGAQNALQAKLQMIRGNIEKIDAQLQDPKFASNPQTVNDLRSKKYQLMLNADQMRKAFEQQYNVGSMQSIKQQDVNSYGQQYGVQPKNPIEPTLTSYDQGFAEFSTNPAVPPKPQPKPQSKPQVPTRTDQIFNSVG